MSVDAPGQQQFVAASDVFSELSAKHHDRGSPRFAAVSSLSTRSTTRRRGARG